MDTVALVIVSILIAYMTWLVTRKLRRSAKLPPGPYSYPIVGNILQLGKDPHVTLAKLAEKYGPLMSFRLGSVYTLVVSSPEMAREVLQKHGNVFAERPIGAALHVHDHHKLSMAFLPVGDQWRKLRKISQEQIFTNTRLNSNQAIREEKLEKLYQYIERCSDSQKAVNVGEAAFATSLNLTSATLFSVEVADYDTNATQEFRETFESLVNTFGAPNVADFFPALKPIDPQRIMRKADICFGKLLGFIEDQINQRMEARRSRSPDSPTPTDFMETLIDLMEDEDQYQLSTELIKHLLLDLVLGAADTASTVVEWALTELLLNPEKFSKAKHELSTLVGHKKHVQESDIAQLPYLQAVVKEIFRFRPPGAFLLPRRSEHEVEVCGYTIPKDAQTIINLYAFGRDPKVWENPDRFKPERFLDSQIDFKGQNFQLLPFGSGRRICPGLPMASRMVHMMLATLLHKFEWKLEVGTQPEFHKSELRGLILRRVIPLMATPIKSQE